MSDRPRRSPPSLRADGPSVRSLPGAAAILRAVRESLDVKLPPKRKETTRKYLAGQRARGEGVLRGLADAVAAAGYLSSVDGDIEGLVELVTNGLSVASAQWDQLVGHTRLLSTAADFKRDATQYLRLAAIDAAIRGAAFEALACIPPVPTPIESTHAIDPLWASDGGVQRFLRALPKRLDATRSALSQGKRFDELFQGRHRPSPSTIRAFADVVADHDKAGTPATTWRLHLLWTFALSRLCDEIADILGRGVVEDVAAAFRRVRTSARRVLAEVSARASDRTRAVELLATLVVEGARSAAANQLIDHLARDEGQWAMAMHAIESGSIPEQPRGTGRSASHHVAWATDIRACHAPWILCEFARLVPRDPPPVDGIPEDVLERLGRGFFNFDTNPQEFLDACFSHPAASLWASRVLVQQAFLRGNFENVLPMIARYADVIRTPDLYFEAALIHAAAGRLDETLRYVEAIGHVEPFASLVRPVAASALAFTGRHADALQLLDALNRRDGAAEYLRGVALRGLDRVIEALEIFERIIAKTPDHAPALEQAARCCYALAQRASGKTQAKWTTTGNRYAKQAKQLGRPNPRSR